MQTKRQTAIRILRDLRIYLTKIEFDMDRDDAFNSSIWKTDSPEGSVRDRLVALNALVGSVLTKRLGEEKAL